MVLVEFGCIKYFAYYTLGNQVLSSKRQYERLPLVSSQEDLVYINIGLLRALILDTNLPCSTLRFEVGSEPCGGPKT